MSDRELAIKLAADASELTRAQREGAAGFNALGAAGKKAGEDAAQGAAATTSAATAEAAAINAARRTSADALRAQQQAMREQRAESNLLKQANRQLAMQMTDVVTSVASGMPIWMVAIQQGGQIRDAYGGVGASLRAIAGMITPTVVAMGGLSLVAGAVALAYRQGTAEADSYARALIMSGNAAGTTLGQLDDSARSISAMLGTQAAAAEALAAAAGSGRVTAANLEMVAATAVQMERTLGIAVGDTVAQFAELGRAPLQASVKLNEQYRYLTAAVYDQIKALEKEGQLAEAAALAQTAYADAMKPRLADLEGRLGSIERAWRAAGDAAKSAWDFMLNIGRQDTPQQQIAALDAQIAQAEQRLADAKNGPLPAGPAGQGVENRELARLKAQRDTLAMQIYMQGESAAAEGAAADAAERHIKTAAERDRKAKAAADEAAREQKARTAAELDALRRAGQGMAAIYADEQRVLDAQRSAGVISDATYYATKRQLIEQAAADQRAALAAENARLQAEKLSGADKIKRDSQVAANVAEAGRVESKAKADITLANIAEAASLQTLARAQQAYVLSLQQANAARSQANSRDLSGRRLGDGAREAAGRDAAIADQFNSARSQLDAERAGGNITQAVYSERLSYLRAYYNQALEQEQAYQDSRVRIEADASVGLDRALANYTEASRNAAQQSERAWTNAFNGMEDAIVRFAMTGKLSFSDLANSIVADLIRIQLRKQLAGLAGELFGPSANAFGGANSGGFGSGAGFGNQDLGQFFHGGGVVGTDAPAAVRAMPAGTFRNAMRQHTGLAGNEYAAILQKDESVLTPGQMRQLAPAGGARGSSVSLDLKVINQSGTPVAASARQTGNGGIELLLTAAENAIAGNVGAGQGPVYAAFKGRFGLRD